MFFIGASRKNADQLPYSTPSSLVMMADSRIIAGGVIAVSPWRGGRLALCGRSPSLSVVGVLLADDSGRA
jgi:hypothetical protein